MELQKIKRLNHHFYLLVFSFTFCCIANAVAQEAAIKVTEHKVQGAFSLVTDNQIAGLVIDKNDAEVVKIAAQNFSNDVKLVTGNQLLIGNKVTAGKPIIIAGTLGSPLIDQLMKNATSLDGIRGKWEAFGITLIKDVTINGNADILLVAGSDPRGTAYGLFELSRKIGVHPFYWWADVTPKKMKNLYVAVNGSVIEFPSIKYRGIFLNDEDWGLNPWAANNVDTDVKDIGPKTYEKIFELLLRLKANYLWPAMHKITKAFWYYEQNPVLAKKYAIVLGASHCEPMLRNNVFEWNINYKNEYNVAPGEWRYDVNKEQIAPYWNDRVKASKNNDAVYTIGMRGIHDGKMPGPPTLPEKKVLMETIIADQRNMLASNLSKTANQVPQIFCPYKEVLDIYQLGLNLPEDVTIAWADDNHGYIRQLPNPQEQKRSGRGGVYYHVSYFGKPADYLWLSSNSPSLISYELTKAHQFTADNLWVFNVGDIKPAELETQFALDLAWNIKSWGPEKAHLYTEYWAAEIFGAQHAKAISDIKQSYYQLAAGGKPEHLNKISFTNAEALQRLIAYAKIVKQSDSLKKLIPQNLQDAYFQLVYYPVVGAKLMNEKIHYALKSKVTNDAAFTEKALKAYQAIQELTNVYNTQIAGGKWKGMMDASPRKQAVFNLPEAIIDLKDTKNRPTVLPNPNRVIQASAYQNKYVPAGAEIQKIKGLGIAGDAITISGWKTYKNEVPYVEYVVNDVADSITLKVKCLPTFPLYDGLELKYGVAVNNGPIQWINIETKADTDEWGKNVLQGYVSGTTKHKTANKKATIKLYFPDAGLVVSTLEIY